MRLSRRSEYGLRALDRPRPPRATTGPIALATLAERNRLPAKFLEQIMATLKHAGIVRTTLGAHGGYAHRGRPVERLDRPGHPAARRGAGAARLRLAPLLRTVLVLDEATCALRDVMLDVRDAMLEILDKETLADLAARPGPRLDRPARPPRRRPGRPPALRSGRRRRP